MNTKSWVIWMAVNVLFLVLGTTAVIGWFDILPMRTVSTTQVVLLGAFVILVLGMAIDRQVRWAKAIWERS
jgi:hypothetical protein